ncbi:MAG: glycosyltransferase [Cyanobacteria bacterium P01_G01_bin.38]
MKIAILCHLDHPISSPFAGGLEVHTWHLARSLIAKGHEVTTFASGDSDPCLNLYPATQQALQLEASFPPQRDAIKRTVYQKLMQVIQRGGFDIIHNNSLNTLPLLAAHRLGIPMVSVLHTPPFAKLATAAAIAHQAPNARFIAISRAVASQWRAYVDSKVVYNGINVSRWAFSPTAVPKTAIWFGRFVPEKSPHEAVLAARKAGFSIRLAGPVSDTDYFSQKIVPLLQDEQVQYLGHLTHAQLEKVVGQSAVFIKTPLWQEPYGLVYAESLACGTPVATFDNGAGKEILTRDCGRVVSSRSVEALARAVRAAAQLSRQACRQRAEQFCQLATMINTYEEIYRQVAMCVQSASAVHSMVA